MLLFSSTNLIKVSLTTKTQYTLPYTIATYAQNGQGPTKGCFWIYVNCSDSKNEFDAGNVFNICSSQGDFSGISLSAAGRSVGAGGVVAGTTAMDQNASGVRLGPQTSLTIYGAKWPAAGQALVPANGILTNVNSGSVSSGFYNFCSVSNAAPFNTLSTNSWYQAGGPANRWNDKPRSFAIVEGTSPVVTAGNQGQITPGPAPAPVKPPVPEPVANDC